MGKEPTTEKRSLKHIGLEFAAKHLLQFNLLEKRLKLITSYQDGLNVTCCYDEVD